MKDEKPAFKRHPKRNADWYTNRILEDVNSIQDLRLLSILVGTYLDYILNEIIIEWFEDPKMIIDDKDYTFDKKLNLLVAVGFWKNTDEIYLNIKIINSIRNYYAHNILEEEGKVPTQIKQKIDTIKYSIPKGPIPPTSKFKLCVMGCIANLMNISAHFRRLS